MRERAPQGPDAAISADMSRRRFLQFGTAASVVTLITSCSPNTSYVSSPPTRTTPRSADPNSFDNLTPNETIIGVPFALAITLEDGTEETVQARFIDSMTIEINGDTHTISDLTVNNHSVSPEDDLGGTGYTVKSLVENITPNTENTGICFHSSLGDAHVSKEQLSALFRTLRHPKEGSEESQSIWVKFDVELSDTGRSALGLGNVVNTAKNVLCIITGQESSSPSSIDIPNGCTMRITSTRAALQESDTPEYPTQELPPDTVAHYRKLFEKWFPWANPRS
jgi:hypothetical protein